MQARSIQEQAKGLPVLQGGEAAGQAPQPPIAPPEPSAARLILTLGIAGLISGLSLVSVYIATEPAIERNRIAAIERAVLQVLPGAERFEVFVERGEQVVLHADDGAPTGPVVYGGFDGTGKLVGYAIPGAGPGFQDTLEILIGWDASRRRVVGMSVLETRETPGLGDKIITDTDFTSSFLDLSLDPPAVLVEPGRRQEANEVDGISGATISAAAIVRIVNSAVSAWDGRLPDQAAIESMRATGGSPAGGEEQNDGRPRE